MTAGMHCSTERLAGNNNNVGIVFGFFFPGAVGGLGSQFVAFIAM